jgi:hypothetical protein
MMNPHREVTPLVLVTALVLFAPARAATIKTVALQNQPSPRPFLVYKKFERPAISDAPGERVAVWARVPGTQCIFGIDPDADPDGTVACERDSTPDGHLFAPLAKDPSINITSTVAWSARVTTGRSGVFRSGPAIVSRLGDPVPAPGTGLLKSFSFARITNAGDVFFAATISGGAVVAGVEVDQGLFRCSGGDGNCSASAGGSGTLTTVALVDDPVPDRAGRRFCRFLDLVTRDFGIAFRAVTQLDCANGAEAPATGVFLKPLTGTIATVALQGEACEPNPVAGGTVYQFFPAAPGLSSLGVVAFEATTTGLFTGTALYLCDPANGCPPALAAIAVAQGDSDGAGRTFFSFSAPALSDARDIGFSANAVGSTGGLRHALYIRRSTGNIETIAAPGDPVPGSSPPALFLSLGAPSMSPGGKLAFGGRIERDATPRRLYGLFVFE